MANTLLNELFTECLWFHIFSIYEWIYDFDQVNSSESTEKKYLDRSELAFKMAFVTENNNNINFIKMILCNNTNCTISFLR